MSKGAGARCLLALSTTAWSAGLSAQHDTPSDANIVVNGRSAVPGPEIKGLITTHTDSRIKVTAADGTTTAIAVTEATRIRAGGGLFSGTRLVAASSLLDGLPVTVQTSQPENGTPGGDLVARRISFRKNDLKIAAMIRGATGRRFEEQAAATEALRGRMGDIDKYNVKSTFNVHFATGKADLSARDKADLCATAEAARKKENALLLVIGYTDSTGGDELNQELSERRASRVINHLQQVCGWKPYRMLTPTGMAKADPLASNATAQGKAQNRRVAVNILVSKSVDGL